MPEYGPVFCSAKDRSLTATVFTKLASQLTPDKLGELAVIPFIFATQTLVSYLCAIGVSGIFGFAKRPRNFVVAMGVSMIREIEASLANFGRRFSAILTLYLFP